MLNLVYDRISVISRVYFVDVIRLFVLLNQNKHSATSGIGTETSGTLALRGVHVVMAVRNTERGKKVKENILNEKPFAKVDVKELDLSSMASVRKFAEEYKSSGLPLNILINNAGVMGMPFTLSQDNIELVFATNHLGHFLLTNLLLETMKSTTCKSQKEGRIINVASSGYTLTYKEGILFDTHNDKLSYNCLCAYGQSKLANILHANELAKHFKEEGVEITANSVHPGLVDTNIARHLGFLYDLGKKFGKHWMRNCQQGAATTCYVALHPQVKGVTGEYFADSNIAKRTPLANDIELAKKLWDFSLRLTELE